jgi:hypothetical protein
MYVLLTFLYSKSAKEDPSMKKVKNEVSAGSDVKLHAYTHNS